MADIASLPPPALRDAAGATAAVVEV